MLFVACETAAHPTRSLPDAAVAAGAKVAIGFEQNIGCSTANEWVKYFFDYYIQGYSASTAANYASNKFDKQNTIRKLRIVE